jgi:hypothetical protein
MNDESWYVKFRRAPSGKVYVVWHGNPICDEDGGLRYFDTEEEARDALKTAIPSFMRLLHNTSTKTLAQPRYDARARLRAPTLRLTGRSTSPPTA